MKIFLILCIAFANIKQTRYDVLDKEVMFVGPFKKLLDFGYVYKNKE